MKTISKISCALLGAMLLSSIFSGLVVGITEAVKLPLSTQSIQMIGGCMSSVWYVYFFQIIYVFLTIFLYLLKCPQSLILSALRAFCFCAVNSFRNLVQAGADPSKLCVVLPEETVINIIDISVEDELPEES